MTINRMLKVALGIASVAVSTFAALVAVGLWDWPEGEFGDEPRSAPKSGLGSMQAPTFGSEAVLRVLVAMDWVVNRVFARR